nr:MAG TPA: hypothetical protein [Caudoviricetes sp.]
MYCNRLFLLCAIKKRKGGGLYARNSSYHIFGR